jgi:hypothetical protein
MAHGSGVKALPELQHEFQAYVLQGDDSIAHRIGDAHRVDPARRLRIYYDAYRLRLVEVLAADYEALRRLLGEDDFNAACRAYVEAHPSNHRNVRWYGAQLPDFLRVTPPWSEDPLAAELALFEWTLTLAFDAADRPVVRFDDLAGLPPDAWPVLGFALHPSVNLIELRGNAPALRQAADHGEALPGRTMDEQPRTWAIWRKQLTSHFRSLGEQEAWALKSVRAGASFAALCEGLCDWYAPEQAAPQAAQLLRQWVDDELIGDLNVGDEEP